MTLRIKHKVNVRVFSDTALKNALFAPDDALSEKTIDTFVRHSSSTFTVAATLNENLPLGDITAVKGLYLEVYADCIVKLNGGTEEFQLKAQGTTSPSAKLFFEGVITQVNVTAGAAALSGVVCVWGDTA
jgi:hypothetical protein